MLSAHKCTRVLLCLCTAKENLSVRTYPSVHPYIYFQPLPTYPVLSRRGLLEPIPAIKGREAWCTLGWSLAYRKSLCTILPEKHRSSGSVQTLFQKEAYYWVHVITKIN